MKKNYINLFFSGFILLFIIGATGCQLTVYDDPPCCGPPPPPPCVMGYNGLSGRTYLSLDYSVVPPTYIWGNNPSIPSHFTYGSYYQSFAGTFDLYYEGAVMDGCCLTEYYWDVRYSLWILSGTNGGCGYNGVNGPDAYAKIWMDPLGPEISRINKTDEKGDLKILTSSNDFVEVELEKDGLIMRASYTRVNASRKAELDFAGILSGEK